MKRLNKLCDNFVRTSFINKLFWCCLIFIILFHLIFIGVTQIEEYRFKVSLVCGGMFGFLMAGMLSMAKESETFWVMAKEVGAKINQTNDKKELQEINYVDLTKLNKKAMGNPHDREVLRLYTIIETKIKFINELNAKENEKDTREK